MNKERGEDEGMRGGSGEQEGKRMWGDKRSGEEGREKEVVEG